METFINFYRHYYTSCITIKPVEIKIIFRFSFKIQYIQENTIHVRVTWLESSLN